MEAALRTALGFHELFFFFFLDKAFIAKDQG